MIPPAMSNPYWGGSSLENIPELPAKPVVQWYCGCTNREWANNCPTHGDPVDHAATRGLKK